MEHGKPVPQTGMARPFFVAFDTQEIPNHVVGVRVRLDTEVLSMEQNVSINLSEHPLYPKLVKYVQSNPIPVKKQKQD